MSRLTRAATAVAALLVVAALPAAPAAAVTADPPWSGYRLAWDGTAAGGWIGGRQVGAKIVYRIDPTKKPASTGFRAASPNGDVTGSGPREVTPAITARAAYVVGKYGSYEYGIQNAAVDAALHHLLHGGRFSMGEPKFRTRTGATPYPALVRDFAETMLRQSARYAGPYRITVSAPPVPIGAQQTVSVRVTAIRSGARMPNLPVRISYPDQAARTVTTDSRGLARAAFAATVAGPRAVTATVGELPETRLWVRWPETRGASRVVLADIKARRTVRTTVPVQARPVLGVTTRLHPMRTAERTDAALGVSGGYAAPRTARVTWYGPFATQTGATCTADRAAVSGTSTVSANGTYRLPRLLVPRYGWYVAGVHTAANSYNTAAWTCGAHTLARMTPRLTVVTGATSFRVGSGARARATIDRLPAGYSGNVTFYLYGGQNYREDLACAPLVRKVSVRITAPGTYRSPAITVPEYGWFAWRARLDGSTFSVGRVTGCKAVDTVFKGVR